MSRKAGRRRRGKEPRSKREIGKVDQLPWQVVENNLPPLKLLSEEQLERIHQASLEILRDMGLEFMSKKALEVLDNAGAYVDRTTQMVRFDPALIEESMAKAPIPCLCLNFSRIAFSFSGLISLLSFLRCSMVT